MRTLEDYVRQTKAAVLDDANASDRALAAYWGMSASSVSNARYDWCSDPVALRIADALKLPPGELLWAARTAREKNPVTKRHLQRWAERVGKAMSSVPAKAAAFLAAVALGSAMPTHDAQAGGAGGNRT